MIDDVYPRLVSARESEWLDFLLPMSRPGYASIRAMIDDMCVVGIGRWGEGDMILGAVDQVVDLDEGMMPVLSSGEIAGSDSSGDDFTVTFSVHEPNADGMIEFHYANLNAALVPESFAEVRRWTYASWLPGQPCPATGQPVREVKLSDAPLLVLTVSVAKGTLWIYDAVDGVIRLVPISHFYNELMLMKGIRDPTRVLSPARFFTDLSEYTDVELKAAFVRYNNIHRKVDGARLQDSRVDVVSPRSIGAVLRSAFSRKKNNG